MAKVTHLEASQVMWDLIGEFKPRGVGDSHKAKTILAHAFFNPTVDGSSQDLPDLFTAIVSTAQPLVLPCHATHQGELPLSPDTCAYAFFDVDGTVISRDSFMLLYTRALKASPARALFFLVLWPVFLLTLTKKIDKRYAKSCMLWMLTVGRGRRGAIRFFHKTMDGVWDDIWFQEMDDELRNLRARHLKIAYVTASGQIWIRHLIRAKDHGEGAKVVIGSKLGFFAGGVILKSPNCYSVEKVRRIEGLLGKHIEWVAGYSDHSVDIPMLARCREKTVVRPASRHIAPFKLAFRDDFRFVYWQSKCDPLSPAKPAGNDKE